MSVRPSSAANLRVADQQIKHAPKLRYGHTSVPCIVTDLPPSSLATIPSTSNPLPSVSSDLLRKPESKSGVVRTLEAELVGADVAWEAARVAAEHRVERGRRVRPAADADDRRQLAAVVAVERDRPRAGRRRRRASRGTRRRCSQRALAGAALAGAALAAAALVGAAAAAALVLGAAEQPLSTRPMRWTCCGTLPSSAPAPPRRGLPPGGEFA